MKGVEWKRRKGKNEKQEQKGRKCRRRYQMIDTNCPRYGGKEMHHYTLSNKQSCDAQEQQILSNKK